MLGSTVSHYRITGKLGTGGMGVVYEAEDMRLARKVALKFLPEESADDPDAERRFQREADTIAQINFISDNAVRSDEAVVADASVRTDNRCRMNGGRVSGCGHYSLGATILIISASAAS